MARVKTWIWVVAGLFVMGIMGLIAMAAAGVWFAKTHIDIRNAPSTVARSEFDSVRDQFASQKPLIELDAHGEFLRANTDRPNGDRRPDSLYVMAFNPHDGRIVRVTIPFWLLRFKTHGRILIDGRGDIDLADLHLTVEDLERYGPTLILDHRNNEGERVLVWSQ
ncbi:MAG TPA: hypothetical protein VL484_18120 [Vicinamibacterales bacterium]|jgi:hypothetical protein|nr:hypothetical protein [Vicinamibacterales bacterium]